MTGGAAKLETLAEPVERIAVPHVIIKYQTYRGVPGAWLSEGLPIATPSPIPASLSLWWGLRTDADIPDGPTCLARFGPAVDRRRCSKLFDSCSHSAVQEMWVAMKS